MSSRQYLALPSSTPPMHKWQTEMTYLDMVNPNYLSFGSNQLCQDMRKVARATADIEHL
jgi:hypothetical protein